MKSSTIDPSQFEEVKLLLETLKRDAARENKRNNLDLLWTVLNDMHREGLTDFGISEVGGRFHKAGGVKTQSLRNEGGLEFRKLIEAFGAIAGTNIRNKTANGRTQLDIAVEALSDPALRAMFRQVVAENKLLKGQNDQLRSAFKEVSVRRPIENQVATPAILPKQESNLTEFDIAILRKSISISRMDENGWKVLDNGGIADDSGLVVLPPGFLNTIYKIINS